MQHRDDQPPVSSRPSLLSSEQQAEADRLRAQSKPEFTPASRPRAPRSKGGWIVGGAVIALCASGALWFALEPDNKALVSAVPPAAALVAVPAAAATAPAPASHGAVADAVPEPDVSVAAILNDSPAPAQKQESLREMLSAPTRGEPAVAHEAGNERSAETARASAKASDRDELNQLLEASPSALASTARKPAREAPPKLAAKAAPAKPEKPEKHEKHEKAEKVFLAEKAEKAREQKLAAKKKEAARIAAANARKAQPKAAPAKAAPSAAMDDDVTLLAALVAHSHRDNAARAAALNKLKQCKALAADAAEQCRARLCAGSARNTAECKPPRIVKANAD